MSDAPEVQNAPQKPAILQDTTFSIEEGLLYRAFRTGAIWMNKVSFSAVFLWVVWVSLAALQGETNCVDSFAVVDEDEGSTDTPTKLCNVFLTTTSLYLMAMTIVAFGLSVLFGLLGLVVGKKILESTAVRDEVGAGKGGE